MLDKFVQVVCQTVSGNFGGVALPKLACKLSYFKFPIFLYLGFYYQCMENFSSRGTLSKPDKINGKRNGEFSKGIFWRIISSYS